MDNITITLLAIAIVSITGLALGSLRLRNICLGVGGVLFTGIIGGYFIKKYEVPMVADSMAFIQLFGLVLFVYTIGIEVGPGFFASLKKSGLKLNLIATVVVIIDVIIAIAFYKFGGVELQSLLGILSGSTTNTPLLGAAQQALSDVHAQPSVINVLGLSYAVTYPFGIVGVFIVMMILKLIFKADGALEADLYEQKKHNNEEAFHNLNVILSNPNLDGEEISSIPGLKQSGVVVSRILRDGNTQVPKPNTTLMLGDILKLVGPKNQLKEMRFILGKELQEATVMDTDGDIVWERIAITNKDILGKSVASLDIHNTYGVVPSRIIRSGMEFPAKPDIKLQFGDTMHVIGKMDNVSKVAVMLGNSEKALLTAQLMPIFIGIVLGIFIGILPINLPGVATPIKLGFAGGPLIVAILLARIGHIGPIVWFMPHNINKLIREIGIVLYLAVVGIKSGGPFLDVITEGDGIKWMIIGAIITTLPIFIVGLVSRFVLKENFLTICGVIAGAMTDGASLTFANSDNSSEAPTLAYSTVYPLVTFLRVITPQLMVLAFWNL